MPNKPSAALAGIKVVDFGHYVAGPLAGMLLADQGADVVKVQQPGSQENSEVFNAVYNRGKSCVTLDLKNADDLARAKELITSADVVIENFRLGVMDKLGLGSTEIAAENPKLIYLSMPGFASGDQENANVRAFEGLLGGATGLFTDINQLRSILSVDPLHTPIPPASVYGAIHGVNAITMALIARETSGEGDVIEVPLVSAAMFNDRADFCAKINPSVTVSSAPWPIRSVVSPYSVVSKRLGRDTQQKLL